MFSRIQLIRTEISLRLDCAISSPNEVLKKLLQGLKFSSAIRGDNTYFVKSSFERTSFCAPDLAVCIRWSVGIVSETKTKDEIISAIKFQLGID